MFILRRKPTPPVDRAKTHREHAKALLTKPLVHILGVLSRLGVEYAVLAFHFVRTTKGYDALRRSLGDQEPLGRVPFGTFDNHRKSAAVEVEWDFVALNITVQVVPFVLQDGGVERTFYACFEFAV